MIRREKNYICVDTHRNVRQSNGDWTIVDTYSWSTQCPLSSGGCTGINESGTSIC